MRHVLRRCRRVLSSQRAYPDIPRPNSLSAAQAVASSRIVVDFLRHGASGTRLENIGTNDSLDVHEKWTGALQVLVAAQAHCAHAFGYEGTNEGVMAFRTHLAETARNASPDTLAQLKALEIEAWAEILLRGFALAPRELSVDEARAFAARVSADVSRLDALTPDQVAEFADLSKTPEGQVMALQKIQKTVFEIQRALAPEFGFEGDDGWVQLQAALVAHMNDPVVLHSTSASMHLICQRAGIKAPF